MADDIPLAPVEAKKQTPTLSPRHFGVSTAMDGVLSPETARRLMEVTTSVQPTPGNPVKDTASSAKPPLHSASRSNSKDTEGSSSRFDFLTSSTMKKLNELQVDRPGDDLLLELDAPDDGELDSHLQKDPCVLCYGDKVTLRSVEGTFLGVRPRVSLSTQEDCGDVGNRREGLEVNRDKYELHAEGNPMEQCCVFIVVSTSLRSKTGPVKSGDTVALLSLKAGRHVGVFKSVSTKSFTLAIRRKAIGKSETFKVVDVPSQTVDKVRETQQRQQTRRSGSSSVAVTIRSSDLVAFRSVFTESLLLGADLSLVEPPTKPLDLYSASRSNRHQEDEDLPSLCQWAVVKFPSPYHPVWSRERPYLNGIPASHNSRKSNGKDGGKEMLPLSQQERLIVDDLLYAIQGIQGEVVNQDVGGTWSVNTTNLDIDPALKALAKRVLPLCGHFQTITEFITNRSRFEHGRVAHALAAAMRKLLGEYNVLVAQLEFHLEKEELSLQKMWFYLQPALKSMGILAKVAERTFGTLGGALLNELASLRKGTGDSTAQETYGFLLRNAALPYLEMLELWIYHGVIRDPFKEFMIQVDEDATKGTLNDDFNARYWDRRYTIRQKDAGISVLHPKEDTERSGNEQECVPFFLRRVSEKVLTTGKYLNVVRECGRWVCSSVAGKIEFTDEDHCYERIVSNAHEYASQLLLTLLLKEEKLVERLGSLKHYFLLNQGDFFVHFMDMAQSELMKPASSIAINRLQSLLDMALRLRNFDDPFQEDLTCELVPYSLIEHVEAIHGHARPYDRMPAQPLTGVDAFTMDIKVRWPLSLVLSKQSLTKYQLIFRHLFFCKHVEKQLCTAWVAHQSTKELDLRSAMGPDYCLRQRMLHFLHNFEYYVTFEVLEPRWHELEIKMKTVRTVDELMKHHAEYLDTCLRECLLTHQSLLKQFAKLMTTCLIFAQQVAKFADQLQVNRAKRIYYSVITCMSRWMKQ